MTAQPELAELFQQALARARFHQPNQVEYYLFYREKLNTNDIAKLLEIPEYEADRRRLQQARVINAKFRTSRYSDNLTAKGKGQKPSG